MIIPFTLVADDYLVVHGLNTSQLMLDDLVEVIEKQGHKVHRLILSGHHKTDWISFTKANKEIWEADFIAAYKKMGKKKHLVAYSLGALVSMYASSKDETINFESTYLFSPAVSTRWYVSALKPLSWLGIKKIKSQVPADERVHPHTPMPAYMAIFEMQDWLNRRNNVQIKFGETIIFMDEKDKLVSFSGVESWISKKKYKWSMKKLVSTRSAHHMVLNKKYLESKSWDIVEKAISTLKLKEQ